MISFYEYFVFFYLKFYNPTRNFRENAYCWDLTKNDQLFHKFEFCFKKPFKLIGQKPISISLN